KRLELLFVGNGFARKGLSFLLESCKLLKTDFHLSIVGADKNSIAFQKQAAPLKDKVTFFGAVSNVRPFYQKCDALIVPTLYDPFANVTVEALAMGLFVISSQYNGAHEILTPQTGEMIEDLTDPESILSSLQKACERPKTIPSALLQRESVKHLQFENQLG